MTIKKALFLFVISAWIFYTPPLLAHVLERSDSVGAIMHVTPNDDPIAGRESTFFFEFKDRTGRFSLEKCGCVVTISKAGEMLHRGDLAQTSFSYTFPERGVYTVVITGNPKVAQVFEPFRLYYDVRVTRQARPTKPPSHRGHLIGAAIFVTVTIALFIKDRLHKK